MAGIKRYSPCPHEKYDLLSPSKTASAEAATERCSVEKVFFFARSPCCGHKLICFRSKGYSHRRLFFFTRSSRIRSGSFSQEFRCSGARNKFRTHFSRYSVTQQNTSIYQTTVDSCLSVR